ncbi:GTP cyclohydrolase I [Bernardetia litoralis DSM 6794]|uniref:GTP cyclohydrolase 1 n=1 Tax=Bernardetia litoralis (strain ATCC 23117 / DSM 6794 / NBRC 15988 / NCIMB 1366 / Fx l1 / Sio-4) TaxID=880071 RepID=I4AJN6_BERLS|nr:GTP cyclohydrolase I FolE [Bernardetia litoralis]AFM04171.1 GTP cyclohydrolase I [Bernardetia litoralis DSM 6794]
MPIINKEQIEIIETIGDNHIFSGIETPLLSDAFEKSDDEKIKNIEHYFGQIMNELGLDLSDDSLSGTPYRVAKMYVKELFYGLDPKNKPKISTFLNKYGYKKMLVEQNITIDSACEHHFLPITGHAHVGYIPKDKVIGLSKINRLVDYYAHRPQVQERLALQILNDLQTSLETEDVIVMLSAKHLCVSSRGIKDKDSFTTTIEYGGCFENKSNREEFFGIVGNTSI